jgi:hypothetical protein
MTCQGKSSSCEGRHVDVTTCHECYLPSNVHFGIVPALRVAQELSKQSPQLPLAVVAVLVQLGRWLVQVVFWWLCQNLSRIGEKPETIDVHGKVV